MVVFLCGLYHGVFASASQPPWALARPSTDSIALLAFATAFRSWPQPQWALLLYAASTTFSGTGIPPSAQLSTLLLALSPLPRCLDALRILFSCCSMALFLVTPAMRPVMAWFQGAFFWLCRLWLALAASDFALAGQPSRYLFLVPFAQRHSNGWR